MSVSGFNHWDKIEKALDESALGIVREGALYVVEETRARAAVKTGNMRIAIYRQSMGRSTYGRSKPVHLLPEIPPPADKYTAHAAAGADYSIYVNNGTRFMRAQPFWEPGVAAAAVRFQKYMNGIVKFIEEAARK